MGTSDQDNASLDQLESDNWQLLYRCRWDADHRAATIPILKSLLTQADSYDASGLILEID